MVEMDQDRQTYATQQENFKKNVVQVWKVTNFVRHAALFDDASMEAVTYGFSGVRQLNPTIWTAR